MHYPNVPYFQQKAEASSWDGNMSMASAHRHISASAMSLVARVFYLLIYSPLKSHPWRCQARNLAL